MSDAPTLSSAPPAGVDIHEQRQADSAGPEPNADIHERRKADHIRINLEENVTFRLTTGLEEYFFMHQALPELDLAAVDTGSVVLGKQLNTPLLISSMTGGTAKAREINRTLAAAAQEVGMAMGLGSMRAGIEDPALESTYQVRDVAPDILLFANLGAVQLNYGYDESHCRRAVDMIDADALILHFNALQEAVQPEGDGNFAGLVQAFIGIWQFGLRDTGPEHFMILGRFYRAYGTFEQPNPCLLYTSRCV